MSLFRATPSVVAHFDTLPVDSVDIYESHNCQCPPRSYRAISGKRFPGNHSDLLIFVDMLYEDGHAGVWIPRPTCVCGLCFYSVCNSSSRYACWFARAAQEDDLGQVCLTNIDFLKNGIPASIIVTLVRGSTRDGVVR